MSTFFHDLREQRSVARRSACLAGLLALLALTGCSGGGGGNGPQSASVVITPPAATLAVGGSQTFVARVDNIPNQLVRWGVTEGAGGTITKNGFYTAPATAGTYHIVATSVADPTKSAAATVTVTAPGQSGISVSLAPTSVLLFAGGRQTFVAVVTNATNQAVTWSVREGATGGTITPAGEYTAPAGAGTFHVVAASAADPSQTAAATVMVQTVGP